MDLPEANPSTRGPTGAVDVDRCIVELQRGRPVRVVDDTGSLLVAALEHLPSSRLAEFADAHGDLRVLLSAQRGAALGRASGGEAIELRLPAALSGDATASLLGLPSSNDANLDDARPNPGAASARRASVDPRAAPALALAKLARVIPVLACKSNPGIALAEGSLEVRSVEIERFAETRGRTIERISEAQVPLAEHEHCEFVVYRERFGDAEHVAIVVGRPDAARPVLVRVHSSCLTGDLFASLRCDCGEQLRGGIRRLADAGGGVLLYLAQEGRGIGLANKLRAYALQDGGLDTLEADRHLGFGGDERTFGAACAMLEDLGIPRVRLLTNNPHKVAALQAGGIEVSERVPSKTAANEFNTRYLETKRDRAGHLLDAALGTADFAGTAASLGVAGR